jgi:hypothetical protein
VNFVIHMLHLLSFYKCFWGMCIVLGGQFCFVLQVICLHLWLDLSINYKVSCWLSLVVVGFLLKFEGQLIMFSCGWICPWILRSVVDFQFILLSFLTCALKTSVICNIDGLLNVKWVKTHAREPRRALDVRFYHKKLQFFFFFWVIETMVIMAHYSFLTHMNVKKFNWKSIWSNFRFWFS